LAVAPVPVPFLRCFRASWDERTPRARCRPIKLKVKRLCPFVG
jgi:hypothetical protein